MKRLLMLLALALSIMLTGCSHVTQQAQLVEKDIPLPTGETHFSQPKEARVKLFFIALEDNGKLGQKTGAEDSLVPIEIIITSSETPLKNTLEKLFSFKEPYYGESGLYNALYRSNLKFEKASIVNGKAQIYLSGEIRLGGVMDIPRVENQLKETALQFPSIRELQIFFNNKPLEDALSLK